MPRPATSVGNCQVLKTDKTLYVASDRSNCGCGQLTLTCRSRYRFGIFTVKFKYVSPYTSQKRLMYYGLMCNFYKLLPNVEEYEEFGNNSKKTS